MQEKLQEQKTERNVYLRWGRRRSRLRRRVRGRSKCEQSSRLEVVQASHFVLLLCWCDWKRGISGSWPHPLLWGSCWWRMGETDWGLSSLLRGRDFRHIFWDRRHPCEARIKIVPSVRPYANEARATGRVFVQRDRHTRHFNEIWRRISNCITKGLQYRVLHKKTHSFPRVCRTKKFTGQKWWWNMKYTLYSSIHCAQVLQFLR
jgi:hypothetical protein